MSLEVERNDDAPLGAVVTGLDASVPLGPDTAQQLLNAVDEHLVLLIRNQSLDPRRQVAFSRSLGSPEASWDRKSRHPETDYVQVLASGLRPPGVPSTSQVWHTDQSFVEQPPSLTILHALRVPEQGGETLFTDMRSVYDELPDATKDEIDGLHGVHSFGQTLGKVRADRYSPDLADEEGERYPEVEHPLVRRHPRTGRPALYMNELCLSRISGLEASRSSQLLDTLYGRALAPERIHAHRWRVGDLLIWDNAALMHRGSPSPGDEPRLLHRTTLAGSRPA